MHIVGDFPSGPLVKNLPANAGHTGSICSEKIPHAMGQIIPCTSTTEPVHSKAHKPQQEEPLQ